MTLATRITMIVIVTISSMNVKPRRRLPLRIGPATAVLLHGLTVHIEHTLPAPTLTLGIILIATQAPLGLAGEGIHGNASKETHLLAVRAGKLHAFDQKIQRLRIIIRTLLLRPQV